MTVPTGLRNLDSFALKNILMQRIAKTLARGIGMGFSDAVIGSKNASFRFIIMALTDIERKGLIDQVIRSSFECRNLSELLVSKLTEEVCKDTTLMKRVTDIINSNETKINSV